MNKFLIFLSLLMIPGLAWASEPANGTVIQIGSVGSFVILSSLWTLWSQRKRK